MSTSVRLEIVSQIVKEGFKNLFIRALTRNLHEAPRHLVSSTVSQFIFSFIGYSLLVIIVSVSPLLMVIEQRC